MHPPFIRYYQEPQISIEQKKLWQDWVKTSLLFVRFAYLARSRPSNNNHKLKLQIRAALRFTFKKMKNTLIFFSLFEQQQFVRRKFLVQPLYPRADYPAMSFFFVCVELDSQQWTQEKWPLLNSILGSHCKWHRDHPRFSSQPRFCWDRSHAGSVCLLRLCDPQFRLSPPSGKDWRRREAGAAQASNVPSPPAGCKMTQGQNS